MRSKLLILSIFSTLCFASCSSQIAPADNGQETPIIEEVTGEENAYENYGGATNPKSAKPGDNDYVPFNLSEYEVSTLTDFGSKEINGSSYFDEGVLYYKNTNNVNHYSSFIVPENYLNNLIEFTVSFDTYTNYNGGSYFSIALRANGCGSVLSTVVSQNGYCFVMHYDGVVQIYKSSNSTPIKAMSTSLTFDEGTKLKLKVGALEENGAIRLVLINNEESVFDFFDTTDPIIESSNNYLTFSSWITTGPTEARIIPTKEVIEKNYKTYTMSTLKEYPLRSGDVHFVDNANTLELTSGADTAGFSINEQNFSLEMKINFSYFPTSGSAFYTALRCTEYGRANTATVKGYSFGLGNGTLYVSKPGERHLQTIYFTPIEENTDHILEYGVVDMNETTTYLFAKLDGKYLATVYDTNKPRQVRGSIIMTNDGTVKGFISSVNSYVTPLKTKVVNEEKTTSYKTYFQNPITFATTKGYEDIGEKNLESIYVNGQSIADLNNLYYGETNSDKAFDVEFKSNIITLKVAKTIHSKADDSSVNFIVTYIKLQKTGPEYGLQFETGYKLKVSYFYNV